MWACYASTSLLVYHFLSLCLYPLFLSDCRVCMVSSCSFSGLPHSFCCRRHTISPQNTRKNHMHQDTYRILRHPLYPFLSQFDVLICISPHLFYHDPWGKTPIPLLRFFCSVRHANLIPPAQSTPPPLLPYFSSSINTSGRRRTKSASIE
jgi:hypothetical protein